MLLLLLIYSKFIKVFFFKIIKISIFLIFYFWEVIGLDVVSNFFIFLVCILMDFWLIGFFFWDLCVDCFCVCWFCWVLFVGGWLIIIVCCFRDVFVKDLVGDGNVGVVFVIFLGFMVVVLVGVGGIWGLFDCELLIFVKLICDVLFVVKLVWEGLLVVKDFWEFCILDIDMCFSCGGWFGCGVVFGCVCLVVVDWLNCCCCFWKDLFILVFGDWDWFELYGDCFCVDFFGCEML